MKTRRSILKSNEKTPFFTFPKEWDTTRLVCETPNDALPKICTSSVLETPNSSDNSAKNDLKIDNKDPSHTKIQSLKNKRNSFQLESNSISKVNGNRRKSTIMDIVPFILDDESPYKNVHTRRKSRRSSTNVVQNKSKNRSINASCASSTNSSSIAQRSASCSSSLFSDLEITPLKAVLKKNSSLGDRVYKALDAIKASSSSTESLNINASNDLSNVSCFHSEFSDRDLLIKSMITTPCISPKICYQSSESSPSTFSTQPISTVMLEGIVAFVDVRSGAANRSSLFSEILSSLGAEVSPKFSIRVTHVVFKDGSKVNYRKALERGVHIVSTLWLEACQKQGEKASEADFPAINPFGENLEGGRKRKPRSMQPRSFEDDERIAEARVKKKFMKKCSEPSTSDSVFQTPTHVRTHSEDINSPLFGIDHLLTPLRQEALPCTDKMDHSHSSSSESEDVGLPLAVRMYYKYMSPVSDPACQRVNRLSSRAPLSPLVVNESAPKSLNVSSLDELKNLDLSDQCTPVKQPTTSQRRKSMRIANIKNGNNKFPSLINNNDSSTIDCELQASAATEVCENSISKDNFVDASMQMSPTFKSKRISKSPQSNQNSCSGPSNPYSSRSEGPLTKKSSEAVTSTNKTSIKDPTSSTFQGVSSSQSSFAVSQARKRRLHTVGIMDLNDDLIVPSTPTSPERAVACPYDSLSVQDCKTQRTALKVCKKNCKKSAFVFPLPRKTRVRSLGDDRTMACSQVNSNLSQDKQETDAFDPSEISLSPIFTCIPKKSVRFSMIPSQRKSIEEFRQNPTTKTRKSIKCFNLPPSICISSVHSKDMQSLHAIIKKLGGHSIVKNVDDLTTHVVSGSERRTINILLGIARGCWILDVSWLYESVELEKWAPEEPFEMFNFCPGAKIRRMSRENFGFTESLFGEVGRIFFSEECNPASSTLKDLVTVCGGNIASTLRSADIFISPSYRPDIFLEQQITEGWILDSVQFAKLMDIENYKCN